MWKPWLLLNLPQISLNEDSLHTSITHDIAKHNYQHITIADMDIIMSEEDKENAATCTLAHYYT